MPYDADLQLLQQSHDKIIETQQKIQARFAKQVAAVSNKAKKEKDDKLEIMRQIDNDRTEREYRQALRTGMAPKHKQSLDEQRKQAVMERMARQKAKSQQTPSSSNSAQKDPSAIPGSFPKAQYQEESEQDPEDSLDELSKSPARPIRRTRKSRRSQPMPIEVNKKAQAEGYETGVYKLGGPSTQPMEAMDGDEFKDFDDDDDEMNNER